MSNDSTELPVFPTSAPDVFDDRDVAPDLFSEVLDRLAAVIDVDDDQLDLPTPCAGFTVAELRAHTLGWLEFFSAALSDPADATARPDPDVFVLADGTPASDIVRRALVNIRQAIATNDSDQLVTMSSSRMAADGVLGMALGEYIIHAWDLAAATGHTYSAPASVVAPAHAFLEGMVAPEFRGPDSGFFDAEVAVSDDASPLDKLLGFAGRDPQWAPV
ncbi:MAG: TIGR03086 family metal-binding protein [Acidimicrobiales bacterium]